MASSKCQRFEAVVAAGDAIDADLSRHAAGCPQCRALAEIAALRLTPVPMDGEDPLRAAVQEAAARTAAHHRARWERQRRVVPLLIGLAGYLLAAAAVLAVCLPIRVSLPLPPLPLAAPQVALPPPSATQIVAAFAASALWIAAVAIHWRRASPRRA